MRRFNTPTRAVGGEHSGRLARRTQPGRTRNLHTRRIVWCCASPACARAVATSPKLHLLRGAEYFAAALYRNPRCPRRALRPLTRRTKPGAESPYPPAPFLVLCVTRVRTLRGQLAHSAPRTRSVSAPSWQAGGAPCGRKLNKCAGVDKLATRQGRSLLKSTVGRWRLAHRPESNGDLVFEPNDDRTEPRIRTTFVSNDVRHGVCSRP